MDDFNITTTLLILAVSLISLFVSAIQLNIVLNIERKWQKKEHSCLNIEYLRKIADLAMKTIGYGDAIYIQFKADSEKSSNKEGSKENIHQINVKREEFLAEFMGNCAVFKMAYSEGEDNEVEEIHDLVIETNERVNNFISKTEKYWKNPSKENREKMILLAEREINSKHKAKNNIRKTLRKLIS